MSSSTVATALRALAELAPAAPERMLDVTRGGQPLLWLADPDRHQRDAATDRLAAVDLLHRDERILRRGLGLVVGTVERDGVRRRVRLPLLSEPVRLEHALRGYRVVSAGELELTSLVTDRAVAANLESVPGLGGPGWLTATGTQAWLAVLFTVRDVYGVALADGLRAWAGRDLTGTALAAVYQPTPTGAGGGAGETTAGYAATPDARFDAAAVESPLPLTAAQSDVVRRVRRERLTVVSGPPGNGKGHTVVAAALDTVDRETGLIRLALETEELAAAATSWEPLLGALSLTAPGAFAAPGMDLAGAARQVRLARGAGWNWRTRWLRRAARRWLRRRLGVAVDLAGDTDGALDQVADAVEAARAVAARARLAAAGGTDLAAYWDRLDEADRELAERVATAMRDRAGSERRWDPAARRNAGALASWSSLTRPRTATRSGLPRRWPGPGGRWSSVTHDSCASFPSSRMWT
ncbi:hypothetical protein [Micromonospora sp. LOL_015]|uniref:hypothetical protein n=1 Tax=Micromonospora sp. LOL_015 TaxID=3345416 RepID=UPI003A880A18